MPQTIYTLGYQQRNLTEFIGLLRAASIDVLIDVRETAWSHKPGFSKTAFATALADAGIEYVHARFAGNPKSLRSTAPTHAACLERYGIFLDENDAILEEFEQVVTPLLASEKRVCLTCFERHADDCHRAILAERWKGGRRSRRVQHLAVDGCDRLVS